VRDHRERTRPRPASIGAREAPYLKTCSRRPYGTPRKHGWAKTYPILLPIVGASSSSTPPAGGQTRICRTTAILAGEPSVDIRNQIVSAGRPLPARNGGSTRVHDEELPEERRRRRAVFILCASQSRRYYTSEAKSCPSGIGRWAQTASATARRKLGPGLSDLSLSRPPDTSPLEMARGHTCPHKLPSRTGDDWAATPGCEDSSPPTISAVQMLVIIHLGRRVERQAKNRFNRVNGQAGKSGVIARSAAVHPLARPFRKPRAELGSMFTAYSDCAADAGRFLPHCLPHLAAARRRSWRHFFFPFPAVKQEPPDRPPRPEIRTCRRAGFHSHTPPPQRGVMMLKASRSGDLRGPEGVKRSAASYSPGDGNRPRPAMDRRAPASAPSDGRNRATVDDVGLDPSAAKAALQQLRRQARVVGPRADDVNHSGLCDSDAYAEV